VIDARQRLLEGPAVSLFKNLIPVRYQIFQREFEAGSNRLLLHELDQHISFDVDRLANLQSMQICPRIRVRNDGHAD
jgi:hypothetical protein